MNSRMDFTIVFSARFFDGETTSISIDCFPQTQSQELGAETVVDNDMLYDLGMVSSSFLNSGRS